MPQSQRRASVVVNREIEVPEICANCGSEHDLTLRIVSSYGIWDFDQRIFLKFYSLRVDPFASDLALWFCPRCDARRRYSIPLRIAALVALASPLAAMPLLGPSPNPVEIFVSIAFAAAAFAVLAFWASRWAGPKVIAYDRAALTLVGLAPPAAAAVRTLPCYLRDA